MPFSLEKVISTNGQIILEYVRSNFFVICSSAFE